MQILKEKIELHKNIIQNFSYMSVIQVVNMLLPLVIYPYLIRILGVEVYGLLAFAQAAVGYLVILVGFGFHISATKEISLHRDDREKLSEIVSSVFIIKAALFVIAAILMGFIILVLPQAKGYETLFFLTLWMCLYELLFPMWYFQGIEKMKYITYITLVCRFIFLGLIFIFIHDSSDVLYVPIINSIGALIAGLISLYIVFIKDGIKFKWTSFAIIKSYLKESAPIFISRVSSIKDNSPMFFIGLFLGSTAVAYYDLSSKVVRIFISVLDNITNVSFPLIAKSKNSDLNKRITHVMIGLLLLSALFIIIFSKFIILFLGGKEMLPSLPLFFINVFLLLRPLSSIIGTNVLISNGLNRKFSSSLIYSTIFYFGIMLVLVLTKFINIYTLSLAMVFSLFFELLHRTYLVKQSNLLNWIK
jgi:PST family polysaccharide transporter